MTSQLPKVPQPWVKMYWIFISPFVPHNTLSPTPRRCLQPFSPSRSSSSLELSSGINESHLVPSTTYQGPPALSSRVKNSADICTNQGKAGWFAYFCASWRSMSGLCLGCMVGAAALSPEDWSRGRRVYLTLTVPSSHGLVNTQSLLAPGKFCVLPILCPGDLDREAASPPTYLFLFLPGHV